jgi:hypothetical protein
LLGNRREVLARRRELLAADLAEARDSLRREMRARAHLHEHVRKALVRGGVPAERIAHAFSSDAPHRCSDVLAA